MNSAPLTPKQRERILRAATSAPSKHNTQPWWFRWDGDDLEVHVDTNRTLELGDPACREAHIACGAAVFAARLGYASLGIGTETELLPDKEQPLFVARVRVTDAAADPRFETLYWSLPSRRTNRAPFKPTPVPTLVLEYLRDAARDEGTWLRIVEREPAYEHLLTLIREATGLEEEHLRTERARWIDPPDAVHRLDGVPGRSLGPLPENPTGAVRDLAVGHDVDGRGSIEFEQRPTIGVLETRDDDAAAWMTAGQALMRVLVTGTRYGVAASFANQPLENPDLRDEVASDAKHYGTAQMVLRLGMGVEVPPTPRRPLTEVLRLSQRA
ncbi:Acg family FMN-binding oxidoreductase [Yinghuangia sp. YIM S09857]|uniref:Acg family FMN-binding oxidoreductase n=1 Tax=Yinghuangia sp. YIM S09857 TaxID=3436929 RepID=UPI003F530DAD